MKKKYPNLMMQSASSYDTSKVKEAVEQQVKEEQAVESIPSINRVAAPSVPEPANDVTPNDTPTPIAEPVAATVIVPKVVKPRLRQQAYYLTEQEIKTIKRLSYELDIPKSDLVRKFIDEGIARIDNKAQN